VTFVTGHRVEAIDWAKVGASETVVLFMGLAHFAEIAREMIAKGRSPETPAMVVRWATRPDQQTVVGTLADLAQKIVDQQVRPPATFVIGEVVSLRSRFDWFEKLPLRGQRIVVTRDRRQAPELTERLEELGAEAIFLPVIDIREPSSNAPVDAAIAKLETYDWLIFTSANGVRHFTERLDASGRDLRSLRARICAIGPGTKSAIEALHLKVDRIPKEFVAESMLEALAGEDLHGKHILLPRAAVARDVVPVELTRRGAIVDVVEAYRTEVPANLKERATEVLAGKPDWITFTSSSTVTNLVEAVGAAALSGVKLASIGPITSSTLRALGLTPSVEADPHTIEGLVAALA
jgi:uroporphyrinogen III methyltransferase/synthase